MGSRVMAIDPGSARVGVAVSDPGGTVALPLTVLDAGETLLDDLSKLAREHEVRELVVGLPKRLGGEEGPAAQQARDLARAVELHLGLPVHLVDERLTTKAAAKALDELEVGERRRRRIVDKVAATLLLQSYLDGRRA